MWFLVGFDLNLRGEPVLAGLYGPFASAAAATQHRPQLEENGVTLMLAEATNPAIYPPAS